MPAEISFNFMANAPDIAADPAIAVLPAVPQSYVKPFCVGPVTIAQPFVLAPMSGVTDSPFRRTVHAASGSTIGLFVTEFISVEGLSRRNLKSAMRLAFDPAIERPLAVQIFGADIARMVNAAEMVADHGAQIVDINCGCPAPKVVRRGGGAELLRQGDHLAKMVAATALAVKVPVTVKIRSGWSAESINAVEIAKKCEDAGAQLITVHGRTRMQLYTGFADWNVVDAVAGAVRVPVLGSGDVGSPAEALMRLRTTRAAGVMIGRAAIMNPWIFGQIDDAVRGLAVREVTLSDRVALLRSFRDLQRERMPEHAIPGRIKQLLARMTKGFAHGTLLREKAMRAATTDEMFEWIESFFDALQQGGLSQWCDRARGVDSVGLLANGGEYLA